MNTSTTSCTSVRAEYTFTMNGEVGRAETVGHGVGVGGLIPQGMTRRGGVDYRT